MEHANITEVYSVIRKYGRVSFVAPTVLLTSKFTTACMHGIASIVPDLEPWDDASYLVFYQALQQTHHYNYARFTVMKQAEDTW